MSNALSTSLQKRMAASVPRSRIIGDAAAMERVALGVPTLDACLDGGLMRATLHEIYAGNEADIAALTGFTLGIAARAAARRPILWVRQDFLNIETGHVYPPGLVEIGIDPAAIILVHASNAASALQAGLDAARCGTVGVVLIELWGETRALDLTASRRLLLAARESGVIVLLTRISAMPAPSAAQTRWRVGTHPSRALAANTPGSPTFAVKLLRQHAGIAGQEWYLEWNRDRVCFEERRENNRTPLSRPVVSVSTDRPAASGMREAFIRQAG